MVLHSALRCHHFSHEKLCFCYHIELGSKRNDKLMVLALESLAPLALESLPPPLLSDYTIFSWNSISSFHSPSENGMVIGGVVYLILIDSAMAYF